MLRTVDTLLVFHRLRKEIKGVRSSDPGSSVVLYLSLADCYNCDNVQGVPNAQGEQYSE